MTTKIEWTHPPGYKGESWNPLRGCSVVSDGCKNCYAMKVAARFDKPGMAYEGLTNRHGKWNGTINLIPEKLDEPLRARKPRCYFVNSMSDLFHENVPFGYIDKVFAVMAMSQKHRFIVLTKRPARMRDYMNNPARSALVGNWIHESGLATVKNCPHVSQWGPWPLENVLLGVSVENQTTADERIIQLLQTLAACRVVSYEPALGPVDFGPWLQGISQACFVCGGDGSVDTYDPIRYPGGAQCSNCEGTGYVNQDGTIIDWLIVGGESGPGARPLDIQWVRDARDQCEAAGVPFFFKQFGRFPIYRTEWWEQEGYRHRRERWDEDNGWTRIMLDDPKGGTPEEWPPGFLVREWPEVFRQ